MSLTLSPVAKSASLFAPARVGDTAAVSLIAKKTEARQTALDDLKDMPRKVRDDVRAKAKERVAQLKERMKVIKALGENDPKIMAKMLAQLTKELKAAVKAYMDAGGSSSDVSGVMAAQTTVIMGKPEAAPEEAVTEEAAPAEADVETPVEGVSDPVAKAPVIDTVQAAEAYGKAETLKAESEISEVSTFVDEVRGIMKKVKEWLETAKIKLTFQPVDKATAEAFAESDETMKSIDEALEDLDDSLGDERAVMGLRMNVEA